MNVVRMPRSAFTHAGRSVGKSKVFSVNLFGGEQQGGEARLIGQLNRQC